MELFIQPISLDAEAIRLNIEKMLRDSGAPTEVSVFVELRIDNERNQEIIISDISHYEGYDLRRISPVGCCIKVDSPFGLHSTSARREALNFSNDVALSLGGDTCVECDEVFTDDRNYQLRLLSICGGAIFGVVDGLLVASTAHCKVGFVERDLVIAAASSAGYEVVERDIFAKELEHFDELFFCNHYGINAISSIILPHKGSRCTFGNIVATNIAKELSQPW